MPIPAIYIVGILLVHFIDRGEIIEITEIIEPSRERKIIMPEVVPVVHKPDVEIPLWYILLSKIRTKLHAFPRRQSRKNPGPED